MKKIILIPFSYAGKIGDVKYLQYSSGMDLQKIATLLHEIEQQEIEATLMHTLIFKHDTSIADV